MKPIQIKVFKSTEEKETPMFETHILQGCEHILTNVLDIASIFLEKEGFR